MVATAAALTGEGNDRIYLGGMDPLLGLTVPEVLDRLQARASTAGIALKDIHQGRCFMQFSASCTKDSVNADTTSATSPPLDTIKSWFHNVTWKGCKLVVQKARPHFLQRLEEERRVVAVANHSTADEAIDKSLQSSGDTDAVVVLKRHWKVKRGYFGEPVRLVDTQPCQVTDWTSFTRTRKKHASQQEKDRVESQGSKKEKSMKQQLLSSLDSAARLKQAQKQSYYNRSIHLRFADTATAATDSVVASSSPRSSMAASTNTATITSTTTRNDSWNDETSSSSDNDDHVGNTLESESDDEERVEEKSTKYVWSDDEDEDDDNGKEKSRHVLGLVETDSSTIADAVASLAPKPGSSAYAWSEDESSEDERESSHGRDQRKRAFKLSVDNGLDEFAMGASLSMDNGGDLDNTDTAGDEDNGDECGHTDTTLQEDVASNLKVFAELFPEYTHQQQSTKAAAAVIDSKSSMNKAKSSSGWGAFGQMLRFDPTKPQLANQFVLDDDDEDEDEDAHDEDDGETTQDTKPESSYEEGDNANSAANEPLLENAMESEAQIQHDEDDVKSKTSTIYEQDKLEQVFKEVREAIPMTSTGADGASSFSFGFDLGPTLPLTAKDAVASAPFSFAFNDAEVSGGDKTGEVQMADATMAEQSGGTPPASRNEFRPLAFQFPNEQELDQYVHNFYYNSVNDGARIIADLDGWRNDPEVKQRWMKERLALTQDWKRKRKYALSKKQKRFR